MKQSLFLLLAFLGTFVGFSQSTISTFCTTVVLKNTLSTADLTSTLLLFLDDEPIGGRQDTPTLPYRCEIDGSDSTLYVFIDCLDTDYNIGAKFTTSVLNGSSTLVIGGNKPPVGEFIKSNDIGGKRFDGDIVDVKKTGDGALAQAIGGRNSQEPLLSIADITLDECSPSLLGFSS